MGFVETSFQNQLAITCQIRSSSHFRTCKLLHVVHGPLHQVANLLEIHPSHLFRPHLHDLRWLHYVLLTLANDGILALNDVVHSLQKVFVRVHWAGLEFHGYQRRLTRCRRCGLLFFFLLTILLLLALFSEINLTKVILVSLLFLLLFLLLLLLLAFFALLLLFLLFLLLLLFHWFIILICIVVRVLLTRRLFAGLLRLLSLSLGFTFFLLLPTIVSHFLSNDFRQWMNVVEVPGPSASSATSGDHSGLDLDVDLGISTLDTQHVLLDELVQMLLKHVCLVGTVDD
mmetsp:Transcript_28346/g.62523  ORF Transcript_28346/g.62523 Transcript_28346/m.62523 type:complete len:286 (+) Transcript_28346:320-1177(+)